MNTFYYTELKPGIRHVTDVIDLAWYPGDPLVGLTEREISVSPREWPFEAGETPYAYARRIVAGVDESGKVIGVDMTADARWHGHVAGSEPDTLEETITIRYRTQQQRP